MHTTPVTPPNDANWTEETLDRALAICITAPKLPDAFRSRVVSAVLTEQLQSFALRRQQLEAEHAQELARLRQGHVALKRDSLVLVAACAFAAGTCAQMVLPWLHSQFELDSTLTASLSALLIGLVAGASVWTQRFGKAGALFGMLRE
jgi:hypothetical protein